MAINFPDAPSINDTHTVGNKTWTWDGIKWNASHPDKSLNDLADVVISTVLDGQTLIYDLATTSWVNQTIDALPDQTGHAGEYLTTDGTNASWTVVDVSATTVSETPPASPTEGDAWFRSSTGQFFVYYDSYWVEIGAGPQGEPGVINATAPLTYDAETQTVGIDNSPQYYGFNYDSFTGRLIIEYNNIDSSQPAVDVSAFDEWIMANQADGLSFSIVNGHLIMESI